jgi:hypothetical protein
MQRSTSARILFLVLLVLFVLICGLHVAGAHHGTDIDGLGLVDGLAALALVGALLAGLAATRRRSVLRLSGAGLIAKRHPPPQFAISSIPVVPLRL